MTMRPYLFLVVGVILSHPAWAQLFGNPQVEYSDDRTMRTESGTSQQRVYYTPTRERTEFTSGSNQTTQKSKSDLEKELGF
jgi:hypothetical protein